MQQRPGWLQQLGQGLAAQGGGWGQPQGPQGGPPPGVQFVGGPQGMPPQAQPGPDGRPMAAPGAAFLRDQDMAIRAALAHRAQAPVQPGAAGVVPGGAAAPEPDADERGGPPDGDQDDPRMQRGMGGFR